MLEGGNGCGAAGQLGSAKDGMVPSMFREMGNGQHGLRTRPARALEKEGKDERRESGVAAAPRRLYHIARI